jgi:hypothetical protein
LFNNINNIIHTVYQLYYSEIIIIISNKKQILIKTTANNNNENSQKKKKTLEIVIKIGTKEQSTKTLSATSLKTSKLSNNPVSPTVNSVLGIFVQFNAVNNAIEHKSNIFDSFCNICLKCI